MFHRHPVVRRDRSNAKAVRDAALATLETLETRRLFAATGTLIGITGNQQNPDFEDETLYTINYTLPGTSSGPALDGWEDISNPPDTVLSVQAAHGVTQGSGALRVDVPQTPVPFWGIRSPNVVDLLKSGATSLSYDETLIGQELNGGSFGVVFPAEGDNSFNGYAQSNELAVVVATQSGGFIQRNFAAGNATDSMNLGAQWAGQDGTRTITWDLTQFTGPGGQSLADFINSTGATEARFWLPTQGGDTNGNQGPMRFYFDNFVVGGGGVADTSIGDFDLLSVEKLKNLPHVPDTDAIGFNPDNGLLYRTSGSSSYRNSPDRIGYHDNQFMETVDVNSPDLTEAGVFNANYEGENDGGTPTGNYGLPAPFPTFVSPDHRRTDEETDPVEFGVQGPNEYHAARDLAWSSAKHLFYIADEDGLFTLTPTGTSTFVGQPSIPQGGMKGITFFNVGGERKLLVSERDGANLWTLDPETGQIVGDAVEMHDASGNPLRGVVSLEESPDGTTLFGLKKSDDENDNGNHFSRELIIIDPVTGDTTSLGSTGLHMADLAFVLPHEQTTVQVTQVFVNGPGLTGQTSANGVAFRTLAGVDNTYGYAVPAGTNQLKSIPWNGGVNQVALRFNQDVASSLQQGDLVVRGINTANYTITNFSYDPATKTGVWTLSAPITNDKVRLVLDDAQLSGLDGEWQNGTAGEAYPSGNGTAGGDFDFRVNVLRGDATQDGTVNALDLSFVKARLNKTATNPGTTGATYSPFADITSDGTINAIDLSSVRARLNNRLPTGEPAGATALLFGRAPISA